MAAKPRLLNAIQGRKSSEPGMRSAALEKVGHRDEGLWVGGFTPGKIGASVSG